MVLLSQCLLKTSQKGTNPPSKIYLGFKTERKCDAYPEMANLKICGTIFQHYNKV